MVIFGNNLTTDRSTNCFRNFLDRLKRQLCSEGYFYLLESVAFQENTYSNSQPVSLILS